MDHQPSHAHCFQDLHLTFHKHCTNISAFLFSILKHKHDEIFEQYLNSHLFDAQITFCEACRAGNIKIIKQMLKNYQITDFYGIYIAIMNLNTDLLLQVTELIPSIVVDAHIADVHRYGLIDVFKEWILHHRQNINVRSLFIILIQADDLPNWQWVENVVRSEKINQHMINFLGLRYFASHPVKGTQIASVVYESMRTQDPHFSFSSELHLSLMFGQLMQMKFFLERDTRFTYPILSDACQSGNHEIIQLVIDNGQQNWNDGLEGACLGNQLDIINWMIQKGADAWDDALTACANHLTTNTAQMMFDKGARDITRAMCALCQLFKLNQNVRPSWIFRSVGMFRWLVDHGANCDVVPPEMMIDMLNAGCHDILNKNIDVQILIRQRQKSIDYVNRCLTTQTNLSKHVVHHLVSNKISFE